MSLDYKKDNKARISEEENRREEQKGEREREDKRTGVEEGRWLLWFSGSTATQRSSRSSG